ncbi:MAG: hypothetical protein HC825_07515 [Oscillatoriales cyanobacterium RM1_1_9]|nr:hypothetical protein [Oscillatoriales cyanobacterium SM2_3_0]NJO46071.1 hypothetical protein [Oscillatoriales cyanobacterium RM2_1_1]NJO71566.1 hypothetical protein [Oscillatoriales cyanobacterium RM1_1_9]
MEGCTITDLKVNGKQNCYILSSDAMEKIQAETGVSTNLEPGTYVIKIREGSFSYTTGLERWGEPLVMLWIYGGKFINKKTNIEVGATWSTLNGIDDTLTLEVVETASLCAFFFDTYLEDNEGEVTISVVKI